jgi:SAM-dependent methyltransferase
MAAFYEDPGYFEGSAGCGYDDYAHQEPGLRRTFARFLGRLEKRGLTGGSLLEVGCGPGFLLDEAREYFSRRVGTEFSPETAERARGFSDEVVVGGVDALDKGEVFNLVVAVSVLEHVYEPVGFLALMEKHLDTGGAVVLVTPDLDGFWRKGFGSRWPSFKVPEHVTYFNRRTLRQLGRESGLDQVDFWGFTQVFPVSLVLEKLGLKLTSGVLRNSLLPIPFTMLCAVFKRQ